jgi:hypothetical protein
METIELKDRHITLNLLTKDELELFKTEHLIEMLRYERHHYNDYDLGEQIFDNGYNMLQFRLVEYGGRTREDVQKYKDYVEVDNYREEGLTIVYTYADRNQLKEILSHRPHIPNKMENKQMIKERIQQGRKKTKRNLKYSAK